MADIPSLRRIANELHSRAAIVLRNAEITASIEAQADAEFFDQAAKIIRDAVIEIEELRGRRR